MQNTQHTADILTKKCSRCKKEQVIENFGFKLNTDPYKTCKRCRKQPITDNNPGSSNDHLNIIQIIESPVIEQNDIEKDDIQINKGPVEILNNDQDESCMDKLLYIFSDFGYKPKLITQHIIDILFKASDNSLSTAGFIHIMIKHKDLGLLECVDGVNLLFASDDKTVYFMNLKNANLIDNYVSKIKYKNKKDVRSVLRNIQSILRYVRNVIKNIVMIVL